MTVQPQQIPTDATRKLDDLFRGGDYLSLEAELEGTPPASIEEFLSWCQKLKEPARTTALEKLLGRRMQLDRDAAFRWASANDKDFFGSDTFVDYCVSEHDLPFAIQGLGLALSNRDPQLRRLGESLAQSDYDGVINYAKGLPWSDALALIGGALRGLAKANPDAALANALGNPDMMARGPLLADAAGGIAEALGPTEAARRMLAVPAIRDMQQAYLAVANSAALQNPELVLPLAEKAVSVEPDSSLSDSRLARLLVTLGDSNPEIRARVAALTSNPALMVARLGDPLAQWGVRDPAAAFAFAQQLQITPELKAKLLKSVHQ